MLSFPIHGGHSLVLSDPLRQNISFTHTRGRKKITIKATQNKNRLCWGSSSEDHRWCLVSLLWFSLRELRNSEDSSWDMIVWIPRHTLKNYVKKSRRCSWITWTTRIHWELLCLHTLIGVRSWERCTCPWVRIKGKTDKHLVSKAFLPQEQPVTGSCSSPHFLPARIHRHTCLQNSRQSYGFAIYKACYRSDRLIRHSY